MFYQSDAPMGDSNSELNKIRSELSVILIWMWQRRQCAQWSAASRDGSSSFISTEEAVGFWGLGIV